VAHALLLAALNALAAVLVLVVTEKLTTPPVAVLTALLWAVMPNRGSSRFWFSMGPGMVALCLFLVGVLILLRERPFAATALFATSTLTYEACVGLAFAALVFWAFDRRRRDATRSALVCVTALSAAAALVFVLSPKEKGAGQLFANWEYAVPAQFLVALWHNLTVTRLTGALLLAGVLSSIVRIALPSFRRWRRHTDVVVPAAIAVVVLADAPFLVAGFPFATDGIFDRGNIVAGIGVALLFAALLVRAMPNDTRALAVVTAAPLLCLAAQNATDLRDYRRAVVDQHNVLARLDADVPQPPPRLVVGPTMPNRGGVAGFVYPGDLAAAMSVRRGFDSTLATIAASDERFASSRHPRYDWHQRRMFHGG
jgi:hypothetical protein